MRNTPAQSMMPTGDRRRFLRIATGATAAACAPGVARSEASADSSETFFDDIERRTFDFFWQTTNPANGLMPDRYPTPSFSSVAAVGFALTAYPIGVERAYITRAQAVERVLATARFFFTAPQGPQASGTAGYKGFFYHFLDMKSGTRSGNVELSTVDTALLLGGMLFCREYFDRDDDAEREIRTLVDQIYARVDWVWASVRAPAISHGWTPENGFIKWDWKGYAEAMLMYLLALGSPTYPVSPEAWSAWCSTYDRCWGNWYGQEYLTYSPMFVHQFSHAWIDFRGIRDAFMRGKGIDYFENTRRAAYAQRAYAIANPMSWKDYGENVWGFTACDGPTVATLLHHGRWRRFKGYDARGFCNEYTSEDGTVAAAAAAGSLPFAPEIALPALQAMRARYGETIYAAYGFLDAFNPSFDATDVPLHYGRVVPDRGWVATDYVGINQGTIVAMTENHRSGLVWRIMRGNASLRRGLARAGFTGGWLG